MMSRARYLSLITLCLALLPASWAHAQQSSTAFQVEHFEPLPAQGSNLLNVGKAVALPHLRPSVGVFFHYNKAPLVLAPVGGSADDDGGQYVIDNQLKAELLASVGLFDRLELGLALPIVLWQDGDDLAIFNRPGESVQSLVLADARIVPKLVLLDANQPWTRGFGVALMLPIYLPLGDDTSFQSDATVRVEPRLALGWQHQTGVSLWGNAGVQLLRAQEGARNFAPGNTLRWALGGQVPVGVEHVSVIGSIFGSYGLEDARAFTGSPKSGELDKDSPVEFDAGVQLALPASLIAQVGAGAGLNSAIGSPALRIFASLNYTPMGEAEPEDSDQDGIFDPQDKCPKIPGVAAYDGCPVPDQDQDGIGDDVDQCVDKPEDIDGFEDEDGCPDPDNDSDGLLDKDDKCPDQAEDKDGFEDKDGCPDLDNDDDGIEDTQDLCPDIAEDKDGFEDDNGCPDPDNDSDGVLDKDDKCPDEFGVAKYQGCPIPDKDKDGISDDVDKCPDEPETYNGVKDDDGCPDGKVTAKLEGQRVVILDKVYFATNKDTILKKSYPVLRAVAGVLRANPQVTKLRIEGHTDDVGKDEDNMELSKRRAASVTRFLVEQERLDAKRLQDAGYGETIPLCDEVEALTSDKKLARKNKKKVEACRADNRRVEFVVIEINGQPVSRAQKIKTPAADAQTDEP